MPLEEWIKENIRYVPETGHLYWTKERPNTGGGRKRKLDRPIGHDQKDVRRRVPCRDNGKTKTLLAHRIAWFLYYGEWPSKLIDHINRNPGDNRIENLRDVTPTVNIINSDLRKHNTSGFTGIYQSRVGNWIAKVGKQHIGTYHTLEEAIQKREEALKKVLDIAGDS
jgi:hypothetical protein